MKGLATRFSPGALIFIIWAVATLINITKAVHIDDTIYLEIARQMVANPLHPLSGEINWVNTQEPIYRISASPLLWPWLLSGVMRVMGESEIAFHLLVAIFTLAAILFFYALAEHFAPRYAMVLTALFALGPGFLPSQNLMLDVPMLAFWLMFFWSILCVQNDEDRSRRYALAGLAVALACLTKYTSLVLMPLMLLHLVLERRWRYLWALLIPLSALVLWSTFNIYDYGRVHLFEREGGSAHYAGIPFAELPRRFMDAVVCFGAVAPFALVCLSYLRVRTKGVCLLGAGVVCFLLAVVWAFVFQGEDLSPALLSALFIASAVLLLGSTLWEIVAALRADKASNEIIMLASWVLITFAFIVLGAPFLAVRHILPAVPAVLLIVGNRILPLVSERALKLSLTVTICLGLGVGIADWQFAALYRNEAPRIRQRMPAQARVWFMGHWGWQWYAVKSGMQQYDLKRSQLQPGDYLVVPHSIGAIPIAAQYASLLQKRETLASPGSSAFGVRTFGLAPPGGFYGGGLHALPWRLSSEPMELFTIYQIEENSTNNNVTQAN